MAQISAILFVPICITLLQVTGQENDWSSSCPYFCKCKWYSGRKMAECINYNLTSIPFGLSEQIQTLDLSGNSILRIPNEAFNSSVKLLNLHKIFLKQCKITDVHPDAFKGLQILIEIDLSENMIGYLHRNTFKDNVRLRVVTVNRNPLKQLVDGLFNNLKYLQTVSLSDCDISIIGIKAFQDVPNLQNLLLDGNNLSYVDFKAVENLQLRSLNVHNNPWKCDCHLRLFKEWITGRNILAQQTKCAEPSYLSGKLWNKISSQEFACRPHIVWPKKDWEIYTDNNSATLSCKVSGNPSADVYWVFNSRILSNNSHTLYSDRRYSIVESGDFEKWVNLTIDEVKAKDAGEFTCVAKNYGGVDERNVTLVVNLNGEIFGGPTQAMEDSWPLIIGLITGIIALLFIICIMCCCCYRRKIIKKDSTSANTNGDVGHHNSVNNEQEKILLQGINPIPKPPRKYEITKHVGDIEFKEQNKNLLDNIPGSKRTNSFESIETISEMSKEKENDIYPPDLIAFPGRFSTTSPVLSLDRNRSIQPSPLHSIYSGHNFSTLGRSNSPFYPISPPIILPRQGYVTIPRRPNRVPSWSSTPTPSLMDSRMSPMKLEPIYDNLGPRTTADGSSVLSLNKTPVENEKFPFHDKKHSTLSNPGQYSEFPKIDKAIKRTGSVEDFVLRPISPRSKVAPKPPPKPKKIISLYDDEGEDGTEV